MAAHRARAEADERTPRELTQTPWTPLGASIVAAAPLVAYSAAQGYAELVELGRPGSFRPGLIDRQLTTYEAVYMAVLNLTDRPNARSAWVRMFSGSQSWPQYS